MDTANLPPSPKGRQYEIRALGLRDFAGLKKDDEPLDPFELARYAKLLVVPFEQVRDLLSEETVQHLLGDGKERWSGGTCSQPIPGGGKLIILNPTHSQTRHNATLMEEVCHVFLGHKPSRLAIQNHDKDGRETARDYNHADEEAAYSVGAAALAPYTALRRFIEEGRTVAQIAAHFRVSRPLIEYRLKVLKLWREYVEKMSGDDTGTAF